MGICLNLRSFKKNHRGEDNWGKKKARMQEDRSIAHSFSNWLIKDSNKVDVSTEEVNTAVDPHKLSEENVEAEVNDMNERRDMSPEQVNIKKILKVEVVGNCD